MKRLRLAAAAALLCLLVACTGPGPSDQSFNGDLLDPDGKLNLEVDTTVVSVGTGGAGPEEEEGESLVDPLFSGHSQTALPGLPITAICVDGWYSYSKERAGTCAGHGGVRDWVNEPGE